MITTSTPIANLNLPRSINKNTQLQAANPAFEITRLSSMLGFGSQSFKILSIILIAISVLSIFSGLASNFENRLSDLAILRALGYTKSRIFKIISLEGIVIVSLGLIIGILSSVIFFGLLSKLSPLKVSGAKFKFTIDILIICILVVIAGLLAALYPAYKGSRVSVINQLSR